MTWADFYLICFGVGFLLSATSFIAGGFRWHLHLPHLPHGGGHAGGGHAPMTHGNSGGGAGAHNNQSPVSPFNFVTMTAFLAWFGGTGFLTSRFSSMWFALGLLIAVGAGTLGAAIVFPSIRRPEPGASAAPAARTVARCKRARRLWSHATTRA